MANNEKIIELLSRFCTYSAEEITPEKDLYADLEFDSFGLMELIIGFEEEFDINIADSEVRGLITVQDVMDYINKRTSEK